MSLVPPDSALTPRFWRAGSVLAVPRVTWRLSRVIGHVLHGYLRSWLVWPRLDERGRDAECVRWSGKMLRMLGIELVAQGQARPGAKLVVSNHVSWLDIVALNAVVPSRFVSKAEVADWPVVGRMVTQAGTLFLTRERRRDAMRVLGLMAKGLREGHTLAVFPEGTTGTGHGVLHFHPNLLQAAIDADVPVQPVALRYADPVQEVSPLAAYVGDTSLLQSLWSVVSARGLVVHVHVLPLQAATHADRRALAALLQDQIEAAVAP
jgi:1-acyl-sn-glycerol-3-phosphate acyltransferase